MTDVELEQQTARARALWKQCHLVPIQCERLARKKVWSSVEMQGWYPEVYYRIDPDFAAWLDAQEAEKQGLRERVAELERRLSQKEDAFAELEGLCDADEYQRLVDNQMPEPLAYLNHKPEHDGYYLTSVYGSDFWHRNMWLGDKWLTTDNQVESFLPMPPAYVPPQPKSLVEQVEILLATHGMGHRREDVDMFIANLHAAGLLRKE